MPVEPSPIALAVAPSGAGRPLVLLHGWGLSSLVFSPLRAALGEGLRVIAPDLRGHGRSPAAPSATLEDHVADLVALFERLELREALLAGWSLGAQVALAAVPRLAPRLAGLALLAGTPRFTRAEGWECGLPASTVEAMALRFRRDPARVLSRFFDGMFAPGEASPEAVRRRSEELLLAAPPPSEAAALAGLDQLLRVDLRGDLAGVAAPALVLHGDADAVCPPGAGAYLAERLPRARLVRLAGAGHAPFVTRPAECARALARFAGELP
ncbi:alpha/beta fold hydrolase [Anaeromyxobacter paludicola]|uniref:O-methylpimelyl-ACP methylesterase n=1 Tax=Anaeromyxobacter paludicola TaxID=2918171 RepID=A0ABN6NE94_9BACT|nr:alpha/beta fold hydrolase [Anaeromyxobacter paludicola]BDG10333.1 O-methylpimelyl-ACP methylesterase [Anaeromyxobacter paludicola]